MAGLLKLHENPWVFCRGCENGCVWVIRGFAGFPGLASSGSLTPRPSAPPSTEARCTGKLWRIAWKTVKVNLRITRRFLTKNTWEVRLSTCRWRSASWPLVVTSLFCSGISPHAGWITGDRCRWMRPLLCHCKKEGKVILLRNLRIDVRRLVTYKTSEMKDSVWIRFFTLCRVSVDPWYWYPLWCGADLFQSPLQDPNGFVNVVVHDRQVKKVTVRWPQTETGKTKFYNLLGAMG